MDVRSGRNQGSTFRLFFLRADAQTGQGPKSDGRAEIRPSSARRILVVEDDLGVRTLVERVLTRAGYAVSACGSVVAERERGTFDLVIVDAAAVGKPELDLPARVGAGSTGSRVLTMSGDPSRAPGRGPFLAKPFDPQALLEAVARSLRVAS